MKKRPPRTRHSAERGPQASGLRAVVGLHSCREAVKVRPKAVKKIWLKDGWQRSAQLAEFGRFAESRRLPLEVVGEKRLESLARGHQGVACFLSEAPHLDWVALEKEETGRVILLDGIEDPHNLGAMLRTAWLMGVAAVFVPRDRAVGLTPACCKVASGGAEHVPMEASNNFIEIIKSLKNKGFWVFGLAETGTRNLYQMRPRRHHPVTHR